MHHPEGSVKPTCLQQFVTAAASHYIADIHFFTINGTGMCNHKICSLKFKPKRWHAKKNRYLRRLSPLLTSPGKQSRGQLRGILETGRALTLSMAQLTINYVQSPALVLP